MESRSMVGEHISLRITSINFVRWLIQTIMWDADRRIRTHPTGPGHRTSVCRVVLRAVKCESRSLVT
jgi:hypothetical protein